ncbi:hypothetical protein [Blattabacterium cuenoti]
MYYVNFIFVSFLFYFIFCVFEAEKIL